VAIGPIGLTSYSDPSSLASQSRPDSSSVDAFGALLGSLSTHDDAPPSASPAADSAPPAPAAPAPENSAPEAQEASAQDAHVAPREPRPESTEAAPAPPEAASTAVSESHTPAVEADAAQPVVQADAGPRDMTPPTAAASAGEASAPQNVVAQQQADAALSQAGATLAHAESAAATPVMPAAPVSQAGSEVAATAPLNQESKGLAEDLVALAGDQAAALQPKAAAGQGSASPARSAAPAPRGVVGQRSHLPAGVAKAASTASPLLTQKTQGDQAADSKAAAAGSDRVAVSPTELGSAYTGLAGGGGVASASGQLLEPAAGQALSSEPASSSSLTQQVAWAAGKVGIVQEAAPKAAAGQALRPRADGAATASGASTAGASVQAGVQQVAPTAAALSQVVAAGVQAAPSIGEPSAPGLPVTSKAENQIGALGAGVSGAANSPVQQPGPALVEQQPASQAARAGRAALGAPLAAGSLPLAGLDAAADAWGWPTPVDGGALEAEFAVHFEHFTAAADTAGAPAPTFTTSFEVRSLDSLGLQLQSAVGQAMAQMVQAGVVRSPIGGVGAPTALVAGQFQAQSRNLDEAVDAAVAEVAPVQGDAAGTAQPTAGGLLAGITSVTSAVVSGDSGVTRVDTATLGSASAAVARATAQLWEDKRPVSTKGVIEIRMDPPNLGTVWVRLAESQGTVHAQVTVSHPEVQRQLQSEMTQLTAQLASQGVNIGSVQVSTGGHSGSPDSSGSQEQPLDGYVADEPVSSPSSSPARVASGASQALDVLA
jgi:trimeric autotransporter adhesin